MIKFGANLLLYFEIKGFAVPYGYKKCEKSVFSHILGDKNKFF